MCAITENERMNPKQCIKNSLTYELQRSNVDWNIDCYKNICVKSGEYYTTFEMTTIYIKQVIWSKIHILTKVTNFENSRYRNYNISNYHRICKAIF